MKHLIKTTIFSLAAAALMAVPAVSHAQMATNAPAMGSSTNSMAKPLPFHGKIAKIDPTAGTFEIKTMSFSITSTTKITGTNGVPATLADFTVGEAVVGSYTKAADGTLQVNSLKVGGGKKKAKKNAE